MALSWLAARQAHALRQFALLHITANAPPSLGALSPARPGKAARACATPDKCGGGLARAVRAGRGLSRTWAGHPAAQMLPKRWRWHNDKDGVSCLMESADGCTAARQQVDVAPPPASPCADHVGDGGTRDKWACMFNVGHWLAMREGGQESAVCFR